MKLHQMFDEPYEIIGWIGMLCILGGYASISFGVLTATDVLYQLINAVGASALIYNTLKTKAYPVVLLNIVWLGVAIVALLA